MSRIVYSTSQEREVIKRHLHSAPVDYPVCHRSECLLCGNCLRHQQWVLKHNKSFMMQVNPVETSLMTESCRYYRPAQSVTYALGFIRQYNRMSTDQKRKFKLLCMEHIARTNFFYQLAGKRPTTPAEQDLICKCARLAGFNFPSDGFDETFSAPGW